jgi:hypothetical protein
VDQNLEKSIIVKLSNRAENPRDGSSYTAKSSNGASIGIVERRLFPRLGDLCETQCEERYEVGCFTSRPCVNLYMIILGVLELGIAQDAQDFRISVYPIVYRLSNWRKAIVMIRQSVSQSRLYLC